MPNPRNLNERPTIIQTAESILGLEDSKWIYHERALAEELGLSLGQLRGFVQPVGKGGGDTPPVSSTMTEWELCPVRYRLEMQPPS